MDDVRKIIIKLNRDETRRNLAKKRSDAFNRGDDLSDQPNDLNSSFSKEIGIVRIQGKEVLISKMKDTNELLLLDALFKKNDDTLYLDEFIEMYNFEVKKKTKILYTASKKINSKIAAKTNIEDFLLFGTGSAKINPKYI